MITISIKLGLWLSSCSITFLVRTVLFLEYEVLVYILSWCSDFPEQLCTYVPINNNKNGNVRKNFKNCKV